MVISKINVYHVELSPARSQWGGPPAGPLAGPLAGPRPTFIDNKGLASMPHGELGTRLARHENHEAPSRQQTSRERSDRVRSAVDNPVTSFPAGGGVENNGFTNMPHGEGVISGQTDGLAQVPGMY